jgi:hypothetical protein
MGLPSAPTTADLEAGQGLVDTLHGLGWEPHHVEVPTEQVADCLGHDRGTGLG